MPEKGLYFSPELVSSPRRRLYPPACKPYGLEAEPEADLKNQVGLWRATRP